MDEGLRVAHPCELFLRLGGGVVIAPAGTGGSPRARLSKGLRVPDEERTARETRRRRSSLSRSESRARAGPACAGVPPMTPHKVGVHLAAAGYSGGRARIGHGRCGRRGRMGHDWVNSGGCRRVTWFVGRACRCNLREIQVGRACRVSGGSHSCWLWRRKRAQWEVQGRGCRAAGERGTANTWMASLAAEARAAAFER